MKQVIFICLLSIALCLNAANGKPTEADPKHVDAPTTTEKAAPASTPPQAKPGQGTEANPVPPAPQGAVPNPPAPDQKSDTPKDTPQDKDSHNASPKDKDATTTPPHITDKPIVTTEKTSSTPSSTVPAISTTVTPVTVSTTTKPTASTEPEHKATVPPKTPQPVPVQARGFDGASFVGGIILTLGLLAIGFMGFKYYKNQTERNYHTL